MGCSAQRRILFGFVMVVLWGGVWGCVFDPSGRSFDNSNVNNATNSNNTNEGNNNSSGAVCGDGVIEMGEGCDDSNQASGDGCASDCQVEPGWDCSSTFCVSTCGDGMAVGTEECDDGIIASGDGCASDCTVEPFFACEGEVPSVCHCVVYVDQAQVGQPRTGGSWATAVDTVQQGITIATAGCEVWVADGVYHVWQGSDFDTVVLKSGVTVYGGFASTETQVSQRNWLVNTTVLDGANVPQNEQVFHVVTADAVQGATLDGFTVTRGDAVLGRHGGGIFVTDSTVTLRRLRVAANTADLYGGGIYCWDSTVTLARSIIEENDADDGGGVNADHNTQLIVDQCRFLGNRADYYGGGLRVYDHSSAAITSSLFAQNQVDYSYGGAIVNWNATDLTLINCTFAANDGADGGGAIYNLSANSCTVRNSILWGNTPEALLDVNTTVVLTSTIMQDSGWAGANGNLGVDPQLLPSYEQGASSPVIDTADDAFAPPVGLGGNALVDIPGVGNAGTLADMGCFEYVP